MSDDAYNMSMRKFLKQVGVTSQQAIETALREAAEAGTLQESYPATVTLTIGGLKLTHTVTGEIRREDGS
ncbi:MAG: DUF6494 family protein [Pseudomonadota bacterium]